MSFDKQLLIRTPAGMRLIAQLTLYNNGDLDRLRGFMEASYAPAALEGDDSLEHRFARFHEQRVRLGRVRIVQLLAYDDHRAIVMLEAEHVTGFSVADLQVDPEYPHPITFYHDSSDDEADDTDAGHTHQGENAHE